MTDEQAKEVDNQLQTHQQRWRGENQDNAPRGNSAQGAIIVHSANTDYMRDTQGIGSKDNASNTVNDT
jgi:hypothetical protein